MLGAIGSAVGAAGISGAGALGVIGSLVGIAELIGSTDGVGIGFGVKPGMLSVVVSALVLVSF
jgi:hypothetical protein